ncbi:Asp-tRNA(Asn)/Glu-tRNA(Gln) amidotransferase subunit GatB [bacterium]|nr:Asp-tRNA(Asn)/Glu-tRNA(Gln) amidotransferase subunit GatB [bacterium]
MQYEAVIGLEVHVELATNSKLFCSCANQFGAPPNSLVCPICLGLPGSLPRVNQRAVELHLLAARALECRVPALSKFDRKNYFYPDMPKDFQTSQYDQPLAAHGRLFISELGEPEKTINITRIHLEEDTGKSIHFKRAANGELVPDRLASSELSLVDYNRAGVPLMEIVSEPEIRSADEASAYLQKMREILVWLGISDCRMEEGSMRCDANISVRPVGQQEFGTKTEIKNMNSFKSVRDAVDYEIARQIKVIQEGGKIVQETRGWDEARKLTISMRSKEDAHDYRYFPEPDLPPLEISAEWLSQIEKNLVELPRQRAQRYMQGGLSPYDAGLMVQSRALSDFFEQCLSLGAEAKEVSNWLANEVARLSQDRGIPLAESRLSPGGLVQIIQQLSQSKVNRQGARQVLEKLFEEGGQTEEWIEKLGLGSISGGEELKQMVDQTLQANPGPIAEYKAGKEKALNQLVGQVMKQSKGRANAAEVMRLLKEALDA